MMGVIDLHVVSQTSGKSVGRLAIATVEKPPGQDAEPQLDLVEPGAVFRRKMAHMSMTRIAQEGPALHASTQVFGPIRDITPLRHEAPDLEAPMGMKIIHAPSVAPHRGQLGHNMRSMGGKISPGTGRPDIPHDLPCRDHKRSDQGSDTMSAIRGLAFLGFPRDQRLGRVLAWQNLPAGLFIWTNDHAVVSQEVEGLAVHGTEHLRFRLKVRVVAVEPRDTARGFKVRLVQNAPDARATHGLAAILLEGGHQVVKAPARGGAVVRRGFPGGHRHHSETR
jgi:hypothetical protein